MSDPQQPSPGQGDRRERAERLYDEARSLPPAARSRLLDDSCGGDEGLRLELESLLEHADGAEAFFELLANAVVTPELTPHSVVGRYEILDRIGAGGMGTVYRARDTRLQRDVALKFLPPHYAAALEAEEHLLREARAAAALEHVNVCTVYEIGATEQGRPFIAMAFYDGETLKERLLRGPIPVAEAVQIVRQIARGLAAAHAHRIVHRDVKPGNVMLVRDGTVKLLDFGLAKVSDASVTNPGVTPGTVAYMSPEQARGEVVDTQSDLFSLGVVFHEMLTGVQPFRRGNEHAVIQAILHDEPEPLRVRTPDAPAWLEGSVARLLEKDRGRRYGTANELLADFELQTTTAAPAALRFPIRKLRRRSLLVATGGVIFIAAIGSVLWRSTRGRVTVPGTAAAMPAVVAAHDPASDGAKTIAVLPFTNMSRDPDEDYLVDGLTEELIGALSKVSALRVVARTSAFAFKGANRDIREIGRALDVGTILEGSVQKVDDRIRVRAQLINVADGLHLWSETYDREVSDIFALQRDLALRIAGALEAGLSPAERQRLVRRPTTSPEAFALYLKGRHFWNQRTSGAFLRAIEYFEQAIEIDPGYAQAHAGLAAVYSLQGLWGELAPREARERMRAAAMKAVELDDSLAEAHAVLGAYMHVYEWNSEAAEREQLRALELDPSYPTARHYYSNLLRSLGRLDEALVQKAIAAKLDPLDPILTENLGTLLIRAGRFDEALEHVRDALELDSMFWWPHAGLGQYYEATGHLDEALSAYRRANQLRGQGRAFRLPAHIARVLARAGRQAEARQVLGELQAEAVRTGLHDPGVATVLLALDDLEGAFDWLELSYRERHPQLRFIAGSPEFAPFEVEPRYIDLLRRIGVRR